MPSSTVSDFLRFYCAEPDRDDKIQRHHCDPWGPLPDHPWTVSPTARVVADRRSFRSADASSDIGTLLRPLYAHDAVEIECRTEPA